MTDLNLAVIGNCSFGALIDRNGRIVWSCLPHFDDDPVFCHLVNDRKSADPELGLFETDRGSGFFDIKLADFARSEQHYQPNTAILVTTLYDHFGSAVEIVDFAPRFQRLERMFRPATIVRQVRPITGQPSISIRLRSDHSYGAGRPERTRGSNHIRYVTPDLTLRLTTDAPISYVLNETPFVFEEGFTMLLGPDESLAAPIADTARDFYESTHDYWLDWSRSLSIPFEWQSAVIRAAITLKLCSFEETGAIIAALTTSIPEAEGSVRNWDYRYCWLRDAYFVVHALNRLGATRTMEDHIRYITNVVALAENGNLQPVYGIDLRKQLIEEEMPALHGYRGHGPVRCGNQAFEHIQNDVYGAVVLAATHAFFDERLHRPGNLRLFERLEALGRKALELYDQPDAGLWELRNTAQVHTFSSVMCWAACDRLAKMADRLGLTARAAFWRHHASDIRTFIFANGVSQDGTHFVQAFGGDDLDGSLLLLHELGFVAADDPRFVATVAAVGASLRNGSHLMRYAVADDFGHPENAFTICTFWYIDALAVTGQLDEARELFENLLECRNSAGLLSEDINPTTGELWGNFPQTYSMVGLINSAMRLSKNWEDAF